MALILSSSHEGENRNLQPDYCDSWRCDPEIGRFCAKPSGGEWKENERLADLAIGVFGPERGKHGQMLADEPFILVLALPFEYRIETSQNKSAPEYFRGR